ncbi:uncharacterized protein LOC121929711 isoform X3 [Sceloporus undulatus]|uniref:uncharacterized protein LOC121929711 isoform X3 n=1 Tax=Sceloporus undulatus TaxID=8520 RepID=UPI001C4DBBDA|nr:uncharacterized protein LOC121929711 isoform X3 [Sceloporus undulatus]
MQKGIILFSSGKNKAASSHPHLNNLVLPGELESDLSLFWHLQTLTSLSLYLQTPENSCQRIQSNTTYYAVCSVMRHCVLICGHSMVFWVASQARRSHFGSQRGCQIRPSLSGEILKKGDLLHLIAT